MKSLIQFLNESIQKKFGTVKKGETLYVADISNGNVEKSEIKVVSANIKSNSVSGLPYVNFKFDTQISPKVEKERVKLSAEKTTTIVGRNKNGTEYTIIAVSPEELEKEVERLTK